MSEIANPCESYVNDFQWLTKGKNALYAFLWKHGRNFPARAEDHNYPKGEPNSCFNNAWNLAMLHPELTYCEGYAMSVIPMHHAWCVNRQGEVIETTWDEHGADYFGVAFKTEAVRQNGMKSGLPSMLDNHKSRLAYEARPVDIIQTLPKE